MMHTENLKGLMRDLIKGINAWVVLQGALRNKDKIAFVIIMALAVTAALQIYKNQGAKTEAMQEEIAAEEEKISAAKELAKLAQEIAKKAGPYFRGKESLDESALRRLASLNSIKMVSFVQAEGERNDSLVSDLFNLEVKGGYHNLAKFVSSLESRGESLRIETLSLKNLAGFDNGNDEDEDLSLVMRVRVKYIKE